MSIENESQAVAEAIPSLQSPQPEAEEAVQAAQAAQAAQVGQAHSRGNRFRLGRTLVLVLVAGAAGAAIALWVRSRDRLPIDGRAALLEVLPSESLQQSPAAGDLVNRLINKHVALLHDRTLIIQVLQNPGTNKLWMPDKKQDGVETLQAAVRVWPIRDTNMIALTVDAGDASMSLAEAIVNQHLQNQAQISQDKQLERSVILNNLKQRYQFRLQELGRDLREKVARLTMDGMGLPGRLSPKEVQLADLLYLRGEVERKMLDAPTPEAKAALKGQMENASQRIDAMEADLGDLTNALNQYLTMKDDEQVTREQLNKINEELELISQQATAPAEEIRWVRHSSP